MKSFKELIEENSTISSFAEKIVKDLNGKTGLTYNHPRWGTINADVFEVMMQSGRGSQRQKSRGALIKWGSDTAAYQTGNNKKEIRKIARKLIDDFLKSGKKIDVKSILFGDPEAAYKFGNFIILDEKEYLVVFTKSKLKSHHNYQSKD